MYKSCLKIGGVLIFLMTLEIEEEKINIRFDSDIKRTNTIIFFILIIQWKLSDAYSY